MHGLQGLKKATPEKSAAGDPSGRHEDLDGNKNMPSWMVTFKPPHYTGCCNQPAFRDIFFADAKAYVEMGVDMIHVDDAAMNASWVNHAGACFCPSCRAGFREFLRRTRTADELRALGIADIDAFDYREHLHAHDVPDAATYRKEFKDLPLTPDFIAFQTESMRAFYRELRARLDDWSPDKHIPVSVNELQPLPVADRHGRISTMPTSSTSTTARPTTAPSPSTSPPTRPPRPSACRTFRRPFSKASPTGRGPSPSPTPWVSSSSCPGMSTWAPTPPAACPATWAPARTSAPTTTLSMPSRSSSTRPARWHQSAFW